MGAFQLPDSVIGDAVGCLIYSFVCLFANILLVWLTWIHRERTSYVAFIAYFTLLATTSSLVQQFYDYALWRNIMIWQFYYGRDHKDDAEVQYQNEIFGLKLALTYLRIFAAMVEVSLVFFFSFSLAATVYGWWARKPRLLRQISIAGRIIPVVGGAISIILLQCPFTHHSFTAYMIVANFQFVISLVGSCLFLFMILLRYLHSRVMLKTWEASQYAKGSGSGSAGRKSAVNTRSSKAFSDAAVRVGRATFDRWLVIRLTIAFATLSVFEWTNIAPHLSSHARIVEAVNETAPDLSHARAFRTVTGYLSGVSPSLLAFVVFGTTKTFQRKMYETFVPACIRRRVGQPSKNRDGALLMSDPAGGSLPLSATTKRGSAARASPTPPPVPPKDREVSIPLRLSPPSIRRPSAAALGPIHEPRVLWISGDDTPGDSPRLSQMGLTVTRTRSNRSTTYLRPEPEWSFPMGGGEEQQQQEQRTGVPMSRFNSHHRRYLSEMTSPTRPRMSVEGRRTSEGTAHPSLRGRQYVPYGMSRRGTAN